MNFLNRFTIYKIFVTLFSYNIFLKIFNFNLIFNILKNIISYKVEKIFLKKL